MKKIIFKTFLIFIIATLFLVIKPVRAQENATSSQQNNATSSIAAQLEQLTKQAQVVQSEEIIKAEKLREEVMKMVEQAEESFEVKFLPEFPGANTKVSAEAISYTFDTARSQIAWIIGGKVVGIGKSFSFVTGKIGSTLALNVSIITEDQKPLSKNFTFRITGTDLLWETPGYAPSQYTGKVLPISQSLVKVTAVPRGFSSSDSRLIYEWKKNGKNLSSVSGLGKKILNFYSSKIGKDIIEVKISSFDKTATIQKAIQIPVSEPKILFYEEHPLEGPQYQNELSLLSLSKPEFILRAEPFFFSTKSIPLLSYEWKLNNEKVSAQDKINILNLSASAGSKGTSFVDLNIGNPKNIFERDAKRLQIEISL